jgi:hypothetical protein
MGIFYYGVAVYRKEVLCSIPGLANQRATNCQCLVFEHVIWAFVYEPCWRTLCNSGKARPNSVMA